MLGAGVTDSGTILPKGWQKMTDDQSKTYYWHIPTGRTQYTKPTGENVERLVCSQEQLIFAAIRSYMSIRMLSLSLVVTYSFLLPHKLFPSILLPSFSVNWYIPSLCLEESPHRLLYTRQYVFFLYSLKTSMVHMYVSTM